MPSLQPFPATLITGPSPQKTIKRLCQKLANPLSVNNPDILIIKTDHGINRIRQIKNFLTQKPFSHTTKIVIIYEADRLQIPAQNALLKTLEEPGSNRYLILTTAKPSSLLPTIISRCRLINLSWSVSAPSQPLIPIHTNQAKNLKLSQQLSTNKQSILPLMQQQLAFLHHQLIHRPSPLLAQRLKNLLLAISMINHNVDPLSALDFYLLSS